MLRRAESRGATTAVVSGLRPVDAVLDYARHEDVTRIVVGKPTHLRWRDRLTGSFLDAIVRESGPMEVAATGGDAPDGRRADAVADRSARPRSPISQYVGAASVIGLVVLALLPIHGAASLADEAMGLLLAVLAVSVRLGRGPSVLAAVLAAVGYNFFFLPPRFTFFVAPSYVVTFVGMLAVALVVAAQAGRVRDAASAARDRERRTDALYRLARDLVAVQRTPEVLKRTVARIGETFSVHIVALLPDEAGRLQSVIAHGGPARLPAKEEAVAAWAYAHARPAGRTTDTLAASSGLYLPLVAGGQPLGVLAFFSTDGRALSSDERALAEAFSNQAALALRRSDLAGWIWPASPAPHPARVPAPLTVESRAG